LNPKYSLKIKRDLRRIFLSAVVGFLAGSASALFLISLGAATEFRQAHSEIIWGLPLAGLLIGFLYKKWAGRAREGSALILDEIHDPKEVLPLRMAPLVLIGTLLTHLFGGSAGREGTAVQMGASLADQLTKKFGVEAGERKILLMAGMGAGFGAAIGAPLAGAIFGMEVIRIGRLRLFAWLECLVASFVGYQTVLFWGAEHAQYPAFQALDFDWKVVAAVVLAGVLFGLAARIFILLTHAIEMIVHYFQRHELWAPFWGGLMIAALLSLNGMSRYAGLGIEWIQDSFLHVSGFEEPALKGFFTALTLGTGFKGGEFVPLVFIGATLGSALSMILPASTGLLASVGFAAVFAGAANTPIACAVMAMEIFGWPIAPYALAACMMSYWFSGHQGIYRNQPLVRRKL
jgi:H+/Cl- antiporter ClcA